MGPIRCLPRLTQPPPAIIHDRPRASMGKSVSNVTGSGSLTDLVCSAADFFFPEGVVINYVDDRQAAPKCSHPISNYCWSWRQPILECVSAFTTLSGYAPPDHTRLHVHEHCYMPRSSHLSSLQPHTLIMHLRLLGPPMG